MRFSHFGAIVKYTDTRESIVSVSALELSSSSTLPPDGAARVLGHDKLLQIRIDTLLLPESSLKDRVSASFTGQSAAGRCPVSWFQKTKTVAT
jgi:hypothetical protein